MAYVSDENLDSDLNNKNSLANSGTAASSGGGGVMTSTSGGAGEPAAPQGKSSDSGWTNLQSYLDANKDQAEGVGTAVAGTLDKEGQAASDSIGSAKDEFSSAANSAGSPSFASDKSNIDAAVSDPGAWSADASKVSQFQNDLNGSYGGPKSLSDVSGYYSASNKIGQANQDFSLTGSESGRMGLLQKQYARPDYNQGEQKLDQLLLEGNANNQAALSGVANKWSGLGSQLDQANTDTAAVAAQKAADAKAANDYANQQLTGAQGSIQSGIDSRVSDAAKAAADADKNYQGLQEALKAGHVSKDQAAMLGLSGSMNRYTLDPQSFLKYNQGPAANRDNIASSDESAKLSALYKLAGQQNTFLSDPTLAGSYKGSSLDFSGFTPAAKAAEAEYQNAYNNQQLALPLEAQGPGTGGTKTPAELAALIDQYDGLIQHGGDNGSLIKARAALADKLYNWTLAHGRTNQVTVDG